MFLHFCADFSKKPKSIRTIFIYASESSDYTPSENDMVYRGLSTIHEILAIKYVLSWFSKILTKFFDFKHLSKTVSHSIINKNIFWKYVTRPFRCIYVNCFNRLRFLAEVNTQLQQMNFNDNLRIITQEKNMGTIFSTLTVCNIHFLIWKYWKFIFIWPHLWLILVCKISQCLAKSYRYWRLIILF